MFIAQNMKAGIFIEDEKIVYQGDVGNMVYFINTGSVIVQLRQSALDKVTATFKTMLKVKNFAGKMKKNLIGKRL